MQPDSSSLESHDESYFASFTDMLVGIIFIFIILLMIVANNYQEATQSVTKKKAADMVTKINDSRQKALDQARNDNINNTLQEIFYETREKIMREIEQSLKQEGIPVTIDVQKGVLRLPETLFFVNDDYTVTESGKKTLMSLAGILGTYLPCVSATKDSSRLGACGYLALDSDDALDAVFIEAHPNVQASTEPKWLTAVQRNLSIFKGLTQYESYLDKELKNTFGAPILNVMTQQSRRPPKNKPMNMNGNNQPQNKSIQLRFVMRQPTPLDIKKLRDAEDAASLVNDLK